MKIFQKIVKRYRDKKLAAQEKAESDRLIRLSNMKTLEYLKQAGYDGALVKIEGKTYYAATDGKSSVLIVERYKGKNAHFGPKVKTVWLADLGDDGVIFSHYHPLGTRIEDHAISIEINDDPEERETVGRLYHKIEIIGEPGTIIRAGEKTSGISLRAYIQNCCVFNAGKGDVLIGKENGRNVWMPYHAISTFTYQIKEPTDAQKNS